MLISRHGKAHEKQWSGSFGRWSGYIGRRIRRRTGRDHLNSKITPCEKFGEKLKIRKQARRLQWPENVALHHASSLLRLHIILSKKAEEAIQQGSDEQQFTLFVRKCRLPHCATLFIAQD